MSVGDVFGRTGSADMMRIPAEPIIDRTTTVVASTAPSLRASVEAGEGVVMAGDGKAG